MENAWISVGHNFAGFTDKDFSDANYTAQWAFIQYRFKFDQNSVKEGLKMVGQYKTSPFYNATRLPLNTQGQAASPWSNFQVISQAAHSF